MGRVAVASLGRTLVVDGVVQAREAVGDRLSAIGFTVTYAADGLDAFEFFVRNEPDLIVTVWQMPRLNGIGLVRRLREISDVPVIMLSAPGSVPECETAIRVGVDRYLQVRRDLDRVGEVSRELMRERAGRKAGFVTGLPARERRGAEGGEAFAVTTAKEARWLALCELRDELQKQLFDCRGNIAEMARRMGKDRSTIRYHLRRLGMLEPDTSAPTRRLHSGEFRRLTD